MQCSGLARAWLLVVAFSLCGGPVASVPAALISDDFESYTQGNPSALNPPWSVFAPGANATVYATGSAQSPIGGVGDDQGLTFIDSTDTQGPPRIDQNLAVGDSSSVYVQFDFRSVGDVWNPSFQIKSGGTNGLNLHMMGGPGNYAVQTNQQGIGWGDVGTTLAQDTWYRFTLTIAPESTAIDNFDMRIQSLESAAIDDTYTGLLFQNNLTDFDYVRFHFNTDSTKKNGQYYVDNVLVTTDESELKFSIIPVPEPTTLLIWSLLAGLGVGLEWRRT